MLGAQVELPLAGVGVGAGIWEDGMSVWGWFRGRLMVGVLPAAGMMAFAVPGVPAAAGLPVSSAASHPAGAPTRAVHRFIIILRDQNRGLAVRSAPRRAPVRAGEAPIMRH